MHRAEEIKAICSKYGGAGFFLEPVPEKKLRNARSSFPLDEDCRVLAFVDTTVFGSGKNGMAICEDGLYWHVYSRRGEFLWDSFKLTGSIGRKDMFGVTMDSGRYQFNMAGTVYDPAQMAALLQEIKNFLNGERAEDGPSPVKLADTFSSRELLTPDEIIHICKQYSGDGYSVEDRISGRVLKRVRKEYSVPEGEQVIAFINATVFRSGKFGMAICTSGLYWRNDWTTPSSRTALAWWEVAGRNIALKGQYAIELGGGHVFNMAASSFDRFKTIRLLNELKTLAEQKMAAFQAEREGRKNEVPEPDSSLDPTPDLTPVFPGEMPPVPGIMWSIAVDGQTYGPYDKDTLTMMFRSGRVHSGTYLWRPGMDNWQPLAAIPELAGLPEIQSIAAAPTPPPVPGSLAHEAAAGNEAPGSGISGRGAIGMAGAGSTSSSSGLDITAGWSAEERINPNLANLDELIVLPYMTRSYVERIIRERKNRGGWKSADELGQLFRLKPHEIEKLRSRLVF